VEEGRVGHGFPVWNMLLGYVSHVLLGKCLLNILPSGFWAALRAPFFLGLIMRKTGRCDSPLHCIKSSF
jgi:hypothetical protein